MTDNLVFNEYQKSAMAEQYMGDDIMQISKHFSVIDNYLYFDGENTGMYLRGDQGLQGERGERGFSAYELAVANGFEGDEATWLEGLKGDRGSDALLPQLTVSAYNTSEPEAELVASVSETGNNIWNFRFGIPAGMPLIWNPNEQETDDEVPEIDLTVITLQDMDVSSYSAETGNYSSSPIEISASAGTNCILEENHNYEVVVNYAPSMEETSINLDFTVQSIADGSDILLTYESESIDMFIKYYENNDSKYYQIYSTVWGTYNVTIYDRGAVTVEEPTETEEPIGPTGTEESTGPTGSEEPIEPTEPTGTEEPNESNEEDLPVVATFENITIGDDFSLSDHIPVENTLWGGEDFKVVVNYTPSFEETSINLEFTTPSISLDEYSFALEYKSNDINIGIYSYSDENPHYFIIDSTVGGTYNITIYDAGPSESSEP